MVKLICPECNSDNVFNLAHSEYLKRGHYTDFVCSDCGTEFKLTESDLTTEYNE